MMRASWKLREYLLSQGITPYRLARALPQVRQATIYRLASENAPRSVSFDMLSQVLSGLRRITGQDITPNDLIVLTPQPQDVAVSLGGDPLREPLTGQVSKFKRRGPPVALSQPTDMTALVTELRAESSF